MVKNLGLKDLDVLCIGTTCVDMRNPSFDFLDDIRGDGLVADSSRTKEVLEEWLRYDPANGVSAMGGGTLNIAPLISLAGGNAGILTGMGNDLPGKFMKRLMHETEVMPIIEADIGYPSSVSFVKPPEGGKREAILHCPNAMDYLDADSCFRIAAGDGLRKGTIVHYAYSGLSRVMDAIQGVKLAALMSYCRKQGYLTMADTHTYSANPKQDIEAKKVIPQYKLLETALPHLDFFFCSEDEAMMIANTFGHEFDAPNQQGKDIQFIDWIGNTFMDDNTPRIIGVTAGTCVTLTYRNNNHNQVTTMLQSPYIITDASNFVGAGDSFRAGFMLDWIMNDEFHQKFATGRLGDKELSWLALSGHLMAACYVTRDDANPYGNIPKYEDMERVIQSEKRFTDKVELMRELKVQR